MSGESDGSGSIALLSQEGSGIAKRIPRGVVPKRNLEECRFGTTPALRAPPPDSGGEFPLSLKLFDGSALELKAIREPIILRHRYRS
jgi:hypothetical protein